MLHYNDIIQVILLLRNRLITQLLGIDHGAANTRDYLEWIVGLLIYVIDENPPEYLHLQENWPNILTFKTLRVSLTVRPFPNKTAPSVVIRLFLKYNSRTGYN